MTETSPASGGIHPLPADRSPLRRPVEPAGIRPRGQPVAGHDRVRPSPQPAPAEARRPANGELPTGFRLAETGGQDDHLPPAEAAGGGEAEAKLAAARAEYQRTRQIYRDTPKDSGLSFRRWQEFCRARTNLGLAEIGVGTARIAADQEPAEFDPGLIADWETVFDGRI